MKALSGTCLARFVSSRCSTRRDTIAGWMLLYGVIGITVGVILLSLDVGPYWVGVTLLTTGTCSTAVVAGGGP